MAIVKGDERRKNVTESLAAIDHEIRPVLKRKKYVIIKVNNVSTVNQLAATHADAIFGILDYLLPRVKVPIMIAESSAGDTMTGLRATSSTPRSRSAAAPQGQPGRPERPRPSTSVIPLIDFDLHVQPVRLAARLLDPDAFIISRGHSEDA